MDLNCRDHFNATNFQYRFQNPVAVNYETGIRPATTPYLQECPEGGNIYLSDQKAVCVKKKQSCKYLVEVKSVMKILPKSYLCDKELNNDKKAS